MDNDLIMIKVLINGVSFKLISINTNCKYYSIVDKNLITKLRFPRIKIPVKPVISFDKENTKEP